MEFTQLLDKINRSYSQKLPFVAYRKPTSNKVDFIFQKDNEIYYLDNYANKGFVFVPFDNREKTIIIPLNKSTTYSCSFISETKKVQKFNEIDDSNLEYLKYNHIKLVSTAIDFIKKNNIKKVVLSRKEKVHLNIFSVASIFKRLLNNYKNAMVYIWYHPKIGLWFGATPETLISVENDQFKTVALAGTQVYKDSLDVKWQSKEIEEQQIVTDYIFSQINTKIDNLKASEPYTIRAGNLVHLKTDISGRLKTDNDLQLLVKNIHPTPAVCGMPKQIAKEFILDNENYNREFYTGFLGELNFDNNSHLFVNLRCMKITNNTASIYIGGGITKDSVAEKEWQETVEKCKVMKKVLVN